MKSLFKSILLFIIPIGCILYLLPINHQLRYAGLKNDCVNKGQWMYHRVFKQDTPIDLIFFGSSHTLNAIDDKHISKQLAPLKAANFGYCRLGRNLHYSLLKMVQEKKHPKHIILEIRHKEDRYSHPIFPLISESKDVLAPTLFYDRDYFSDAWVHTLYKLELIQDYLFNHTEEYTTDRIYAFGPIADTVSTEALFQAKLKRQVKKAELSDLENHFYNRFPQEYIKRIKAICTQENIKLSFLYIPSFGDPYYPEDLKDRYEIYGNVILPPQSIFDNVNYWADDSHLNTAGGNALSEWLVGELKND